MLILDQNYNITIDHNGVILNYEVKTPLPEVPGSPVKYKTTKEQRFFLSIPQALQRYSELVIDKSESLVEVLEHLDKLFDLIKNLDLSVLKKPLKKIEK